MPAKRKRSVSRGRSRRRSTSKARSRSKGKKVMARKPASSGKQAAGVLAAGMLGYIVGNVPGAVAAGALANHFIASQSYYHRQEELSTVNDMNLVKFKLPGSKTKRPKGLGSRIQYSDTYSVSHKTVAGTQGCFVLRYHLHLNQLTRPTSTSTAINDRSISAQNIFELDPNKQTTGGGVIGPYNPNSSLAFSNDLMYVGKHYSTIMFTSFSNIAAHCELFFLVVKRDTDNEPLDTMSLLYQSYSGGQAVATQGGSVAVDGLVGYPSFEQYGYDPTNHPEFKKWWKIIGKKEFVLQPGNTLRMEVTRKINKQVRRNQITVSAMQKGLTYVPFLIVKPSPVLIRAASDTVTAVNTGNHTIGVMFWDTTNYYPMKGKDENINRAKYYNAKIATSDIAVQQFVDSDDDEMQNVINAQ